jgi:hypothetical protein
MFSRLRVPFLVASLAFLAYAAFVLVSALRSGENIRYYVAPRYIPFTAAWHERKAEEAALKTDERELDVAYASRLREDAFERIQLADFERASVRLDEAAKWDPGGDKDSPDVRKARQTIADNRMPPSSAPGTTGPDKRGAR